MSPETDALFEQAENARDEQARPKLTKFAVGAALKTDSGDVFTAGNVENDSAGLSMCAERVAAFAALAAGHEHFVALAVAGSTDDLSPCGACRQLLAQFSTDELEITYRKSGEIVTRTLGELLPDAFRYSVDGTA